MFNVGDVVRNEKANIVGRIVEIDGDTFYIEQENGVEVDFQASSLVLESAFQAKHSGAVEEDAGAHAYDEVYQAVIDNLYPAIMEIGQLAHANSPRVPGITPKPWDGLTSLQKLNVISDVTDTPVKTWIDASKPGGKPSLPTLQLSLLEAHQKGRK